MSVCVNVPTLLVPVDILMNKLFGTFTLPVCRSELLDGLSKCLESTELRVALKVVPRRSASGEYHRIVLVPHSHVCRKNIHVKLLIPRTACFTRTVRLGDFWACERGSDPIQERLAPRWRSIRLVFVQFESHLSRKRRPPNESGPLSQTRGKR